MPLIRGDRKGWPEEVLIQISQSEVGRCVRTKRWKYAVTAPQASAWHDASADRYVDACLFDLEHDPYELVNLVGLESHRPVVKRMRQRLLTRMKEAGEAPPVLEDVPVKRSGQRRVDDWEVDA